jgi:5-bromo-4-chloroindolyl phosphate hydrolysis protein
MPKSRQRKNHKQKVKNRNNVLKGVRRKMEAQYTEMMTQKLSELQSQMSAMTETESTEGTIDE